MESLVEKLIRDRVNLETHVKTLLIQVSLETAERIAHDCGLPIKGLREKYVEPVVQEHVRKEFLPSSTKRHAVCKGCFNNRMPCFRKALANGFCKAHADQYERYNEKQRALREMARHKAETPQHTHVPSPVPVDGCPACEAMRRRNPFVAGRGVHGVSVLSTPAVDSEVHAAVLRRAPEPHP